VAPSRRLGAKPELGIMVLSECGGWAHGVRPALRFLCTRVPIGAGQGKREVSGVGDKNRVTWVRGSSHDGTGALGQRIGRCLRVSGERPCGLARQRCVVTGGASGFGKGIAARLVAEGEKVIIADIQRDAMEATAAELGAGRSLDRREREKARFEPWPARLLDRYGAVHVVANNAASGRFAAVADLTLDEWRG